MKDHGKVLTMGSISYLDLSVVSIIIYLLMQGILSLVLWYQFLATKIYIHISIYPQCINIHVGVLTMFGAMDELLDPCMSVHFYSNLFQISLFVCSIEWKIGCLYSMEIYNILIVAILTYNTTLVLQFCCFIFASQTVCKLNFYAPFP